MINGIISSIMTSETRNQHYVPQFLLRSFAAGKKSQVYVYDKKTSKTFKTKVRNIAAERDFYNFKTEEMELSLEDSLSNLEANTSAIIKKILYQRSIKEVSAEETIQLSYFAAVQFQRTRKMRSRLLDLDKQIQDKIVEMGGNINKVKNYQPFTEESVQLFNLHTLVHEAPKYAHMFAIKKLVLYEAPAGHSFYLSDDPIALHNHNDFGPYGNLGLMVPGIQIYLPISPKFALCFTCPTISESVSKSCTQLWDILHHSPQVLKRLKDPSLLLSLDRGFKEGSPVTLVSENIEHHNSLQAYHSERYVFSTDGDFELLERMKKANHI